MAQVLERAGACSRPPGVTAIFISVRSGTRHAGELEFSSLFRIVRIVLLACGIAGGDRGGGATSHIHAAKVPIEGQQLCSGPHRSHLSGSTSATQAAAWRVRFPRGRCGDPRQRSAPGAGRRRLARRPVECHHEAQIASADLPRAGADSDSATAAFARDISARSSRGSVQLERLSSPAAHRGAGQEADRDPPVARSRRGGWAGCNADQNVNGSRRDTCLSSRLAGHVGDR